MIVHKTGDLLESNCDYICHQVNCQGKMNSGVAKAVRKKWPVVYEKYVAKCEETKKEAAEFYGSNEFAVGASELLLGDIQIIQLNNEKNQRVINMFSQLGYGYDAKRYTSYDAFWLCLGQISAAVPKGSTIAFPYNIGCGLGGGTWEVVYAMINAVLGKEYTVYIFSLEE